MPCKALHQNEINRIPSGINSTFCYTLRMAEKPPVTPKKTQLGLDDYMKVKEKRAKEKLKLRFPLLVKILIAVPIVYCVVIIIYFLLKIRFLAEH